MGVEEVMRLLRGNNITNNNINIYNNNIYN